jgi:hypothetical protein
MLPIHLRLGLPSGLFPSGFPTNNLYTFPLHTGIYTGTKATAGGHFRGLSSR